jgi:hypothetical protein
LANCILAACFFSLSGKAVDQKAFSALRIR